MSSITDTVDDTPAVESGEQSDSPASSDQPDDQAARWECVIEVGSLQDLFGSHRGVPLSRALREGDGALEFKGAAGGVSRRSAPARAGQVFRATTTVVVTGEGEPAPVHFGPMFLDSRDEVLFHSFGIPVAAFGEEQPVDLEVVAPERTVAVRLRLVGAWAEGKDTSGTVCRYGPSALYRAKS